MAARPVVQRLQRPRGRVPADHGVRRVARAHARGPLRLDRTRDDGVDAAQHAGVRLPVPQANPCARGLHGTDPGRLRRALRQPPGTRPVGDRALRRLPASSGVHGAARADARATAIPRSSSVSRHSAPTAARSSSSKTHRTATWTPAPRRRPSPRRSRRTSSRSSARPQAGGSTRACGMDGSGRPTATRCWPEARSEAGRSAPYRSVR